MLSFLHFQVVAIVLTPIMTLTVAAVVVVVAAAHEGVPAAHHVVGAVLLAEEVQMEEGLVCWFEILIARRDRRISKMPSQNLAQFGMCICQLTTTQSEYSLNPDYFSMPCDL